MSEPVKPIVYYIDHTIPAEVSPVREAGRRGLAEGFRGAPDSRTRSSPRTRPSDSLWDAEDIALQHDPLDLLGEPPFGAIGPSRVDPRTGEIFDADILFEAVDRSRATATVTGASPDRRSPRPTGP